MTLLLIFHHLKRFSCPDSRSQFLFPGPGNQNFIDRKKIEDYEKNYLELVDILLNRKIKVENQVSIRVILHFIFRKQCH
jgi:hypothetical protein